MCPLAHVHTTQWSIGSPERELARAPQGGGGGLDSGTKGGHLCGGDPAKASTGAWAGLCWVPHCRRAIARPHGTVVDGFQRRLQAKEQTAAAGGTGSERRGPQNKAACTVGYGQMTQCRQQCSCPKAMAM